MTYLHFHGGEPIEYEEICPDEQCEAARAAGEMPPIEFAAVADLDG